MLHTVFKATYTRFYYPARTYLLWSPNCAPETDPAALRVTDLVAQIMTVRRRTSLMRPCASNLDPCPTLTLRSTGRVTPTSTSSACPPMFSIAGMWADELE
jgi:hypothetical protein